MKEGMKRFLIVIAVLVVLIGLTLAGALPGTRKSATLDIESVDLSKIPDGTYTGKYDAYRFSTTVKVTVSQNRITDIQSIKTQDGRDSLIEDLREMVLAEQTPDVDTVSSATASSNAYLKAVEIALKNGAGAK